ncbi:hypothetical protein LTR20_009508 [Exophiala xenobiotica]|nr:hypothetical protein LTS13_008536 [Exophiala xenobiotica]KAK5392405.1 hypothetical protein LTR79_010378 [Exophiala xenobiotica]KAK5408704.1 hypothetical protein LTR90_009321 [Exophiala xenobiotica]KAK5455603.1 hypothetical protein LTR20_009508 [Exophiala xenobiotica]KAK5473925.1 hypothetical protein LTR26_009928 [Exophiala xenobiotica]
MRINEDTAVATEKVLLVPYSAHHVPKYHEWMRDPEIQQATASEPLTLDEEYAMQQSWRADADKLTFIICRSRSGVVLSASQTREGRLDVDSMIGDVNLFISLAEDEATSKPILLGELELMIAERSEHRKGYGRSALLAFLQYIIRHEFDILREFQFQGEGAQPSPSSHTRGQQCRRFDHFAVKIGESNHGSIALFEALRFHKTRDTPSYFGEYELRLGRDAVDELLSSASSMNKFVEGYEEIGYSCPS